MRRRDVIAVLAGAAAWPMPAHAQSPTPVIGFLHVGSAAALGHLTAALRHGLKQTGFDETGVSFLFRWADGQYDRLPELAVDLVRSQAAVIVTGGGEVPARAAKAATASIPIVFNVGGDPVEMGLVASVSRPGGNVTGVNILTTELAAKRLALLHDLLPTDAVIAHLVNPNFPPSEANVREVDAAARMLGRKIVVAAATNEGEIDAAFAAISKVPAGAVLMAADPYFNSRRNQIVGLAARYSIPAGYEVREYPEAGGLLSYGTSITESYRQMGTYVGRILKGEKPSEIPVMQLPNLSLVINLKTAKTLGLTIPPGLLARADEVIE